MATLSMRGSGEANRLVAMNAKYVNAPTTPNSKSILVMGMSATSTLKRCA